MEEFNQQPMEEKIPTLLKVLSILSYVSIGSGLFSTILALVSGSLNTSELEDMKVESAKQVVSLQEAGMDYLADMVNQVFVMQEFINANYYVHQSITLLCLLLGLFSVIYMVRRLKKGFHMYIIYNLINLVLVYVSVPVSEVPSIMVVSNLITSSLFIFLYSRNFNWINK
jgi:hypothetical protein